MLQRDARVLHVTRSVLISNRKLFLILRSLSLSIWQVSAAVREGKTKIYSSWACQRYECFFPSLHWGGSWTLPKSSSSSRRSRIYFDFVVALVVGTFSWLSSCRWWRWRRREWELTYFDRVFLVCGAERTMTCQSVNKKEVSRHSRLTWSQLFMKFTRRVSQWLGESECRVALNHLIMLGFRLADELDLTLLSVVVWEICETRRHIWAAWRTFEIPSSSWYFVTR